MWTQGSYHQGMMGWSDGGWSWLFMGGHAVLWLVVLALLVAVLVLALRGRTGREDRNDTDRRPAAKHES